MSKAGHSRVSRFCVPVCVWDPARVLFDVPAGSDGGAMVVVTMLQPYNGKHTCLTASDRSGKAAAIYLSHIVLSLDQSSKRLREALRHLFSVRNHIFSLSREPPPPKRPAAATTI